MRLDNLDVVNFRMLRELFLEGFRDLNVFIGHNATGKSTALTAVRVLLEQTDLELSADDSFRGTLGERVHLEGLVEFSEDDVEGVLPALAVAGLQPEWGGGTREQVLGGVGGVLGGGINISFDGFPSMGGGRTVIRKEFQTGKANLEQRLVLLLRERFDNSFSSTFVNRFVNALPALMRMRSVTFTADRRVPSSFGASAVDRPAPETFGPWMVRAKGEDKPEFEDYRALLSEFLPHIQGVLTSPMGQGILRLGLIENGLEGMTPADLWSSGTAHLSLLGAGLTFLPKGSVVLIEEPELGLHPYAIRRLMERVVIAAEERRIQFFLTTHSPLVAMGIHPDEGDHALWHFSREEDGSATANPRVTEAEVVDAMDSLLKAEG